MQNNVKFVAKSHEPVSYNRRHTAGPPSVAAFFGAQITKFLFYFRRRRRAILLLDHGVLLLGARADIVVKALCYESES
jgi:hypothetical protein